LGKGEKFVKAPRTEKPVHKYTLKKKKEAPKTDKNHGKVPPTNPPGSRSTERGTKKKKKKGKTGRATVVLKRKL